MSDDTTARALRVLDRQGSEGFDGFLARQNAISAVARAAIGRMAPFPPNASLLACEEETAYRQGRLRGAIDALAEHAPDEGDDR